MKLNNAKIESTLTRQFLFATALAVAIAAVGCAKQSEPKVEAAHVQQTPVKQASLPIAESTVKPTLAKPVEKAAVKHPASKVLTYKSRNYGVEFEYPWQYRFASAKTVSNDETLQPKSDGFEGQITLARIDLPKGFYPDTDFDSGYFTLSLNPDVEEKDCKAGLGSLKGTPQVAKINDVEFLWNESEVGGKGKASKVRNYVTFNDGVCYEAELGVKTNNETGLAREVNADQVMHKLEGMLMTVRISDAAKHDDAVQSAAEVSKPEGEK